MAQFQISLRHLGDLGVPVVNIAQEGLTAEPQRTLRWRREFQKGTTQTEPNPLDESRRLCDAHLPFPYVV